jgi:colanic acid biosynthesis glycosyl transferase WcaI
MRSQGKFVIVSQYYAPDPSTTATYLTAIAEGLATESDVLVLCGAAYLGAEPPPTKTKPRIVAIGTWTPVKDALVPRTLAMILFSIRMFFLTFKHVRMHDVVLCVTTPFTLPYPVILATRLRKASATLLIYDFYPEALIMTGFTRPGSFVAKTIRFANDLVFGVVDTIITIGRDVEALLLPYKNVEPRKITFIPNWALLPIRYREKTCGNPVRKQFAEKFVVGLSGNLGFTHSVNTVYDAARLLRNERNLHLLLSGWGVGWKQLKQLYASAPLDNVTLMEPVPDSELETFLSAADAWIIPYRRNVAGVSVPSRIYNLLAVGRPIIVAAEASSEAALILKEEDIGWIVRPEDPLDLANAIRSAASDRDETVAKGRRAALAAERYTFDRSIACYRRVLGDLMRKRHEIR